MKIELWPIDRPVPYARNARKLSGRALDVIVSSLKEFGFRQPIVVDSEGVVVVGHTRLQGAKKLGMKEVPVHVADGLTPGQCAAYRVMDNRSNQETSWDFDLLGPELLDLKALDIDLALTGFDAKELDGLLLKAGIEPGKTDEDAVPEAPVEPVTVPGDLWLLGEHRVLCGDSTSVDAVERLIGGEKADMVFTDPPYGVGFQSGMSKGGTATRFDVLANDDQILDIAPIVASVLQKDAAAFIWTSHQVYPTWREQFAALYKQTIVWHKPGGGIGDLKGNYATDYELCLFCVNGHPKFRGKRGMAVWTVAKDGVMEYRHPTQKPVELAERAMNDFTDAGSQVLDLFGGSGSTLIACQKTGRRARLMELDPKYVDVIVKRWQEFTGRQATLDNDGRTFDEIREQRLKAAA